MGSRQENAVREYSSFAFRLKSMREQLGLDQEAFATLIRARAKLKVDRTLISKWEHDVHRPGLAAMLALSTALAVPVAQLAGVDDRFESATAHSLEYGKPEDATCIWVNESEMQLLCEYRAMGIAQRQALRVLTASLAARKSPRRELDEAHAGKNRKPKGQG